MPRIWMNIEQRIPMLKSVLEAVMRPVGQSLPLLIYADDWIALPDIIRFGKGPVENPAAESLHETPSSL